MSELEKQDREHRDDPSSLDDELYTAEGLARQSKTGDHAVRAGRFVLDPAESRIEYGDEITDRLKKTADGSIILWPQPTSDPEDPQNWSERRKNATLFAAIIAAFQPDFQAGIGSSAIIFPQSAEWGRSPTDVLNLTVNWSVLCLGIGGLFWVILARRYGRLPVMWWTQFFGFAFTWGVIFSKSIEANAAFRCLSAFGSTSSQVLGIYIILDMYPFHLCARKLNLWTAGFILSPFLGPWLSDWIVAANASWRWVYGMTCIFQFLSLCAIVLFMEETMYDRHLRPVPSRPSSGLRYRIETLFGVTGWRMAHYRTPLYKATYDMMDTFWRPQLILPCLYTGIMFGFSIGNNSTLSTFTGEPQEAGGYGLDAIGVAAFATVPIVGVLIGEVVGRYVNDAVQSWSVRRNHGVYEAEFRLRAFYLSMPLFVLGECIIGLALQRHLTVGALVMGYGIAQAAIMINTTIGYAYLSDCWPTRSGEASAWLNFWRTIMGFAIPYFQLDWAVAKGALQTFGCEAAIVAGFFILIVPFLQLKGASIRNRFSVW